MIAPLTGRNMMTLTIRLLDIDRFMEDFKAPLERQMK